MTGHGSLKIQTYCDASFASRGGRSRSGILILLVDEAANRASLILWQSRRQTSQHFLHQAEVVALSKALMPSVVIHGACKDIGLSASVSPEVLFIVKTDSQVTLTQLWNASVTTRSRPFANRFNCARDTCHGTSLCPASVKAVFEPGKSQKADGLTEVCR